MSNRSEDVQQVRKQESESVILLTESGKTKKGRGGPRVTKHGIVAQALREDIENGVWVPGDRIPSEQEIAKKFGVAYMTARQAVMSLVGEGVLERVARQGTFLPRPKIVTDLNRFVLLIEGGKTSLDPYYLPPIIDAFEREITGSGYGFSVHGYSMDLLDRFVPKSALVCTVLLNKQDILYAELLRARGNSVYAINRCNLGAGLSFVTPDNTGGAALAVEHLAALGHSQIGFIRGLPGNIDAGDRRHGYLQGLSTRLLRPGPEEGDHFVEACGHSAAEKMLDRDDPPTAILCASDLSAIGAMKAIAEAGLSVPHDISVVGFGDFPLAKFLHPGLTTVRLPLAALGRTAATQMLRLAVGEPVTDVILPCELIVRDTTGPVSSRSA